MLLLPPSLKPWLPGQDDVKHGHPFPYRTYSCVPLTAGVDNEDTTPVGFLLRKNTQTLIVTPLPDGSNAELWDDLLAEMMHWHVAAGDYDDLPSECWYG